MTRDTTILLVNLGTPASPAPRDVRRFLRQFLSDRRVVNVPRLVWRPLLECVILPVRARRSGKKYEAIWTDAGSPLAVITARQASALTLVLDHPVTWAMRHGEPRLGRALEALRDSGVARLVIVPLFPQCSSSTTGSVDDEVERHSRLLRDEVDVRVVRGFATHPGYIEACARQIEEAWTANGRPDFARGDRLVLSFHGIPLAMAEAGDPYPQECKATADLLRARLGLDPREAPMTFQSKFGPARWLVPATIETVAELGRAGVRRVDVFCPGFVADCLETLEEIELLNRAAYLEGFATSTAGGEGVGEFCRIDCVGAAPAFIAALADIVRQHVG